MQLSAHHVGIIVNDLARSKAFYAALGFEPVSERDDGTKTICFMALGGFNLELFAYDEPLMAQQSAGRVVGFRHLALRTDDMDDTLTELREAGVIPLDVEPRDLPGLARLLFFRDPNGIEIEIMQDLGSDE
ncbi:MAG TPA: VOC family protein [Coriobacteriia bacterium]|nr:VOC family protein [Coriobacteriia bacterium]